MNDKQPLVVIIILNWNGFQLTKNCLNSVFNISYNNYKIIVIDNGSQNNDYILLKKISNKHLVVKGLKENLGFTGGCNFGINLATKYNPNYFLLLNNDTVVDPNFLSVLVKHAESNKKVGLVCPIIYDMSDENKILYSGGNINWILCKPYHYHDLITKPRNTKLATGGALLVRKDLVEHIGLLDNRFFAYFEDVAFSIKTQEAGFKSVCEPRARIYHKLSASSDKKGYFYTYLISRNRILLFNNYVSNYYKIYFFFFNLLKSFFVLLFFIFTRQNNRLKAYMNGFVDGMKGLGGRPNYENIT